MLASGATISAHALAAAADGGAGAQAGGIG
jgi:hypothetical protein